MKQIPHDAAPADYFAQLPNNWAGELLWTSPNGRWMLTRRFQMLSNQFGREWIEIDCWRSDDVQVPVTIFDVYIPKYVEAAWSREYRKLRKQEATQ